MHPVLGQLGPFTFYTYTVLIDLGILAALAALYLSAPAGRAARWLDAGIAATVGAFVGARVLYVTVNGDYYFPNLDEIFQLWQGGLAWPGAAAGGLLGLWWYARRKREPLAPVLDALALPIVLLSLLSWGGCLAAGCAYGYEVSPGELPAWLTSHAPDLYGLSLPRFPTQALGVAWSALALLAAWGTRRSRWPAGARGAWAVAQVATGALLLGFTRADPVPLIAGVRADVVGSALVLLAASAAWAARVLHGQPGPAGATAPAQAPNADHQPSETGEASEVSTARP